MFSTQELAEFLFGALTASQTPIEVFLDSYTGVNELASDLAHFLELRDAEPPTLDSDDIVTRLNVQRARNQATATQVWKDMGDKRPLLSEALLAADSLERDAVAEIVRLRALLDSQRSVTTQPLLAEVRERVHKFPALVDTALAYQILALLDGTTLFASSAPCSKPRYLLYVNGNPVLEALRPAGAIWDNGFAQVTGALYMVDPDGTIRNSTAEERQALNEAADEYSASK
jgi:hypothetical protein